MDAEEVVSKYYGRLFFLPSPGRLVAIYVGILVGVGLVNGVPPLTLHSLLRSVEQYLIIGGVFYLVFMPLLVSNMFSAKRVLGLAAAIFITSLPAELIFFRLTGFRGTGLLAGTGLIFLVLTAFLTPLKALLISTFAPILGFAAANRLLGTLTPNTLAGAALTELSSILVGNVFWMYVEWLGRKLSGVSPLWVTRSFLKTWFTDDPASMDEVFSSVGEVTDVKVKTLIYRREGADPVALVFPSIHYGPFRNVGSASFIYQLESRLEGGVKVLTFHTAGSHEHNVASSKDSEALASKVAELIKGWVSGDGGGEGVCTSYRVREPDGWEALTFPSPSALALLLINKKKGNDDLPSALWQLLETHSKSPKVVAVADSHSFRGPKVDDLSELRPLVDDVLRRYDCREGKDFKVGFGEAEFKGWCRGVCRNVVKAVVLEVEGMRYGIVYVYGNNMDGEYHVELERLVREEGLDDVEVVTPDDHSCAASFQEAPYDVVQECGSLTEAVKSAVKEAIKDLRPAKLSAFEAVIPGVRVAGDKIFDLISALSVLGRKGEKGLMLLLLAINILPIMIYLTLF
ncbi:MAG: DUF2070 family protein [Desulfurococcales archaeon]|nr:DUF2070 family protein [Desulfurococcales archaeon]